MSITLTTTVAGATANSYVSLDDADAYLAQRNNVVWQSANQEARKAKLLAATRLIDAQHYIGYKYDTTTVTAAQANGQALEFPRDGDLDGNGDPYIPQEVVWCCCELALLLLMSDDNRVQGERLRSFQFGDLSVTYAGDRDEAGEIIKSWLRKWLATSVSME